MSAAEEGDGLEGIVTFAADLEGTTPTHVEVTIRCSPGGDQFEAVRASLSLVTAQSVASALQGLDPLRLYALLGESVADASDESDDEDEE